MCVCLPACVSACVRACLRACLPACVPACVRACVACVRVARPFAGVSAINPDAYCARFLRWIRHEVIDDEGHGGRRSGAIHEEGGDGDGDGDGDGHGDGDGSSGDDDVLPVPGGAPRALHG